MKKVLHKRSHKILLLIGIMLGLSFTLVFAQTITRESISSKLEGESITADEWNFMVGELSKFVDGDTATDAVYNDGNVGIGNTNPTEKLDVTGNIKSSGGYCIGVDCITNWTQAGGSSFWQEYSGAPGTIYYNDANAKVGIGRIAPDEKLEVVGNVLANGFCIGTSDNCIANWSEAGGGGGGSGGKFVDGTPDTTKAVYMDGNVGIGESDPKSKFQVGGNDFFLDDSLNNKPFFGFNAYPDGGGGEDRATAGEGSAAIVADINATDGGTLTFKVSEPTGGASINNWVDGLFIQNNGNVGIGTTDPQENLHVSDDARIDGGDLILGDPSAGNQLELLKGIDSAEYTFDERLYHSLVSNTEFEINPGSAPLYISSRVFAKKDGTKYSRGMFFPADGSILLRTEDGTAAAGESLASYWKTLQFTKDGKLGINKTGPSKELDLNGDALISGDLEVGGSITPSLSVDSNAPVVDATLLTLINGNATGDLSQQKTFIDFNLVDSNLNALPQVRIGAEVGENGDANSQEKEGSGAFVVYTSTGTGPTTGDLTEKMRVSHDGDVGIGTATPSEKLHVDGNALADEYYYTSDRRLKENISPIQNALEKVLALSGVEFDWKKSGKTNIGFIAQDVEEVLPEVVNTSPIGEELKSVSYGNLTALLVEALKEQQTQINELKAKVEALSQ